MFKKLWRSIVLSQQSKNNKIMLISKKILKNPKVLYKMLPKMYKTKNQDRIYKNKISKN